MSRILTSHSSRFRNYFAYNQRIAVYTRFRIRDGYFTEILIALSSIAGNQRSQRQRSPLNRYKIQPPRVFYEYIVITNYKQRLITSNYEKTPRPWRWGCSSNQISAQASRDAVVAFLATTPVDSRSPRAIHRLLINWRTNYGDVTSPFAMEMPRLPTRCIMRVDALRRRYSARRPANFI